MVSYRDIGQVSSTLYPVDPFPPSRRRVQSLNESCQRVIRSPSPFIRAGKRGRRDATTPIKLVNARARRLSDESHRRERG